MRSVLRGPGLLLGVGLGGFVDGIVLHQVLQWHHMLTSTDTDRAGVPFYPASTVPGLKMNTAWDGAFHVVTWLFVLGGLALLYSRLTSGRRRAWASRALWGWVVAGWGVFNLVEGIVDHQLLGIHHVRSGVHQTAWDVGFLALGAVLVIFGILLQRNARVLPDGRAESVAAGAPEGSVTPATRSKPAATVNATTEQAAGPGRAAGAEQAARDER